VQIMLGMQTSREAADAMRAEFNLDRPLPVQYGLWIAKVVRGDLGRSIRLNDPVTALLAERFPVSLQLATAGMVFALLVSIPLGVLAALRRNTWIDYFCTGYTVAGFAIPNFGLALLLIWLFSIKLDWLPITGIGSSEAAAGGWWTYLKPYIVPAIALGTLQTAILTRLLRSSMIDVLSQDYMRTAARQGPAAGHRRGRARAQERDDPVRHHGRGPVRLHDRHPGDDRIHLRRARHGLGGAERRRQPRLPVIRASPW
jgi:peptide/nickel transport system permease protein